MGSVLLKCKLCQLGSCPSNVNIYVIERNFGLLMKTKSCMHLLAPKELKILKLFVDVIVLLISFGLLIFLARKFIRFVVLMVGEIDV